MSLRAALEEAFNETEESTAPVAPETPVTPSEPLASATPAAAAETRARDDFGKFAKVETPTLATPAIAAPVADRKAPSSWKPDAQTAWLKADRGEALTAPEIKLLALEAERREGDFHKGVEEFKTHAQKARAYEQAVAPYMQNLTAAGVDAPTAISALLKADHTLRNSDQQTKTAYFAQLARSYGIDLGQALEVPPVDPQVQYLTNQLNQLQTEKQQWHNSSQEQEMASAATQLQEFASQGNVHFDAVRGDMANLLTTGQAKSLKDAYDMAVWMRPDIRQSLIEQIEVAAQQKAVELARVTKAKSAIVGIKGSSPAAGGATSQKGSLRELLEEQFAND